MRTAKILMLVLSLALSSTSFAQHWYRYRHELFLAGGVSAMLGDLGGSETAARQGLGDLNTEALSYAISAGYRYKIGQTLTLRTSLSFIRASASDEYTSNISRRVRNLSVRTDIIEFSPMVEVFLIQERIPRNSRFGNSYFRKRIRGGGTGFGLYVASGITAFYYRPMAQLEGSWHDLRSIGTEGQGLEAGSSEYSEIDLALPFTLGVKFNTSIEWSIGIEGSVRWTFTDYLDDASTDYYNNDEILQSKGIVAAALADRRVTSRRGTEGGIRGNPDNDDVYLFAQIVLSKRLSSKGRSRKRYTAF